MMTSEKDEIDRLLAAQNGERGCRMIDELDGVATPLEHMNGELGDVRVVLDDQNGSPSAPSGTAAQ
jgi:hypothetical protein